jgi:hypothetical protein
MKLGSFLCLTAPWATLAAQPAPEPPPSYVAAPVSLDLAPFLDAIERSAPRVPPGVETWIPLPGTALGSPAYRFNLYRDNLYFVVKDRRILMHTTVHYWMEVGLRMKGWVKGMGRCGLPPETHRRARLGVQAEVAVTPAWGLDLKIAPEEPLRMDGCQITFLGYDITDKVMAGMKDALVKATQGLEQQLRGATFLRQRAEAAWAQARQPLQVAPGVTSCSTRSASVWPHGPARTRCSPSPPKSRAGPPSPSARPPRWPPGPCPPWTPARPPSSQASGCGWGRT